MLVSVIIPTFNDEERITDALDNALSLDGLKEVLVVDAGSTDSTVELASKQQVRIIQPRESGERILDAGASQAFGEALLFLPVDFDLDKRMLWRIKDALRNGFTGGVFKKQEDMASRLLGMLKKVLEGGGVFTGPNGFFVNKHYYHMMGGFKHPNDFKEKTGDACNIISMKAHSPA